MNEDAPSVYKKLYFSRRDFYYVREAAEFLLKKGWVTRPMLRRGSIPFLQEAINTALVVTYARPFTHSKMWPNFPIEILNFDETRRAIHDAIISSRNKFYAHTDGRVYNVRPIRLERYIQTEIVTAPQLYLDEEGLNSVRELVDSFIESVSSRMLELVPDNTDKSNLDKELPLDLMEAPRPWNE